MSKKGCKVNIKENDLMRLDEVRSIIYKERNIIQNKIDTITILIDEFIQRRKSS